MDRRALFLAAVDALERRDLEAMARLAHPDFVLHPIRVGLTGEYYGLRGLAKFAEDNADTFEVFQPSYDEIEELDDGRLFAAGKIRIRGIGSHVDTHIETAGIATFKDGLLAGWHDYADRGQAREAAGLSR